MANVHFNVNCRVLLKLTDRGRKILEDRHAALQARRPKVGPYVPHTDAEGYTSMMLWEAMHVFGPYSSMGEHATFETGILVDEHG